MRKPAFFERSLQFVSYNKERIQNSGLKNVVKSILKSFRKQNSSVQLLFFHLYSAILSRQSFHSIYRVTVVVQISEFILINLPSISTLLIKKSVAVTACKHHSLSAGRKFVSCLNEHFLFVSRPSRSFLVHFIPLFFQLRNLSTEGGSCVRKMYM